MVIKKLASSDGFVVSKCWWWKNVKSFFLWFEKSAKPFMAATYSYFIIYSSADVLMLRLVFKMLPCTL